MVEALKDCHRHLVRNYDYTPGAGAKLVPIGLDWIRLDWTGSGAVFEVNFVYTAFGIWLALPFLFIACGG